MLKRKYLVILTPLAAIIGLCAFQLSYHKAALTDNDEIVFKTPANFPRPLYDFKHNPITKQGFLLGKTLFFDPALSADHSVSCSSCHQQSGAFANLNSTVSTGINGCKGKRNAPPIFNLAWQKEFMWDGRIAHLDDIPTNALTNPCEMGNTMSKVIAIVKNDPAYPPLFEQVFGSREITDEKVLKALAQFTAMLISANSKYDKYVRHEAGGNFTPTELAGYNLFKQKCSTCHQEPLFTDMSYRNNGLDESYDDIGRDSLTHLKADLAKFRVPTLRNIQITYPYMHDGRFNTLKQVLQHYSSGIKKHANLDKVFLQNGKAGIALTPAEQDEIIAFLKTLTDVDFINDRRFNNN